MESERFKKGENIMEKEVKEVFVEGIELNNNSVETNQKSSKGTFLGIVAVASAVLLFKFRHKISTKVENVMIKALNKKGYSVLTPMDMSEISDEVDNILN